MIDRAQRFLTVAAWIGSLAMLSLALAGAIWLVSARVEPVVRVMIALLVLAAVGGSWVIWALQGEFRRRQLTEASLIREKNILRSVLDNLADGVAVADGSGRLTMFNPEAERILGVGQTETGPAEWSETYGLFRADGATRFAADELPLAVALRGERSNEVEMIVRNPNLTQPVAIRVKASPVRDRRGQLWGGVAIFRDVTDRVREATALHESESRFRQLAESIPQVFWVSDAAVRRLVYVSPAYETVFGRPCATLLEDPSTWLALVHERDRDRVRDTIRVSRKEGYEMVYRIVRPDGGIRWIRQAGFPVHNDDGSLARTTGLAEDITAQRAAEEGRRLREFAGHLQDARESERVKVAREIHDELGQSLTGLKLGLALLARRADDPVAAREQLSELGRQIEEIISSVSRISTSLRPDVLDNLGLIEAIRWLARDFEQRSGVRCRLELPHSSVDVDERRSTALFRILQESLTNIARHAEARRADISMQIDHERIELVVADDGRGMPDDQLRGAGSFGLIGMRERALMFGGSFSVGESTLGGTLIRAAVPRLGEPGA